MMERLRRYVQFDAAYRILVPLQLQGIPHQSA
jgi:hypothetical protein